MAQIALWIALSLLTMDGWVGHKLFSFRTGTFPAIFYRDMTMKVRNSLKSLRTRHRDNQLVRRRGRVYIINKTQKRYKCRQG